MVTLTREFKVLKPEPDEYKGCPKYDSYYKPTKPYHKTNYHYKVKDLGVVWTTHEACINIGSYLFISKFLVSWYIHLWRCKLNIWIYRKYKS